MPVLAMDRMTGKLPESVSKEVCAFANTEGGELLISVRNDGSAAGIADPDDVMTRVSNTLHDTILPDIIPFVQIRDEQDDGKTILFAQMRPET